MRLFLQLTNLAANCWRDTDSSMLLPDYRFDEDTKIIYLMLAMVFATRGGNIATGIYDT
jgi:hypothetical protein